MKTAVILLSVIAAVLLALLIITAVRLRARSNRLAESVEDYLQTGKLTQYSLRDDSIARLQNDISDLENRLELEKQHTVDTLTQSAEFVSDVSHQLKTPLAGIRLYCEMLAAEDTTNYSGKELQLIEKTERLIADLLKYQRLRANGVSFSPEPCALRALINEQIMELRPLFPQKTITLTGGASLRCDKQWLGEAIGNVIKNACEHTAPDGEVKITAESAEGFINIAVADNGGGVPEAQLPRLFDRFSKSENASPTGTGLGLAITRTVVEQHHGTVTAVNGEKGLIVTLCLPVIDGNRKI